MRKTWFLMILVFLLFSSIAVASPKISFISSSKNGKITLVPTINDDVTEYKWEIIQKNTGVYSETRWIPASDIGNYVTHLDSGHYFITLKGRNSATDEVNSFTNTVVVSVPEDYVAPDEKIVESGVYSLILDHLPEPLRSFMLKRNSFELSLMVIGSLFGLFLVSRRKKINKYVKLVKYDEKG